MSERHTEQNLQGPRPSEESVRGKDMPGAVLGSPPAPLTEPRMCQTCYEGDHPNCGMQTWCECDCPGRDGCYDYPDEEL